MRKMLFSFLLVIVCLLLIFLLGINKTKEDSVIETNGKEAIGEVIDKGVSRSNIGEAYTVKFKFFTSDGEKVVVSELYYYVDEYHKAVVGQEYLVKYLERSPQKCRIYLDELLSERNGGPVEIAIP